MNKLVGVLVGTHFRPPAKLVIERLPAGSLLRLQAEPMNEFDKNAVMVFGRPSDIPAILQNEELGNLLAGCGWTLEELFQKEEIQLGYLAAAKNKVITKLNDAGEPVVPNEVFLRANNVIAWEECEIKLGFATSGETLVVLVAD